jgi:hypothetical protein
MKSLGVQTAKGFFASTRYKILSLRLAGFVKQFTFSVQILPIERLLPEAGPKLQTSPV